MASRLGNISLEHGTPTGSRKKLILRLFQYMIGHRLATVLAVLFTAITNVLALYGPRLSGYVIDLISIEGTINFPKIYFYCALMAAFYALYAVFQYILRKVMVRLGQSMIFRLRQDAFAKLDKLKISYYDQNKTGDILNRFLYDAETVGTSICQDFITISTALITAVFSVVMMLIISPLLSLVLLVTIPLTGVVATIINKKVRPLFRQKSKQLGELNGFSEENLSAYRSIKAYGRESSVFESFKQRNTSAIEAHKQAEYVSTTIAPTTALINNISLALICSGGSVLISIGRLTLGDISSFILYSRKFSGVINEITRITGELQSALSCAERIFHLIDEPIESSPKEEIAPEGGEIALSMQDVCFEYTPGKPILHNISFEAKRGQSIAIVGQTGCGKTTLISLLMRFYDPTSGKILINDNDVSGFSRSSVRKLFGMVLQDSWIFHGSFRENIAYANQNSSRQDIEDAARACYLHSFIESLEGGYDSIIGEHLQNLSEGQKQLLMISRLMLSDKEFLILDEATSSVDAITEIEIQIAMNKLMQSKTCFIIAHRLSTIKNADLILVMKDGRIAESGKHSELLLQNGEYSRIFNAQFS